LIPQKIVRALLKKEGRNSTEAKQVCARGYERVFKENAVALAESGTEVKEVALNWGVSHWSLECWLKQSKIGKEKTQAGQREGKSFLQRELRR